VGECFFWYCLPGMSWTKAIKWLCVCVCCSQDTGNVLSDQSVSTDNVPLIVDKCIDFIATYGNNVQMLFNTVFCCLFIFAYLPVEIRLLGISKFFNES